MVAKLTDVAELAGVSPTTVSRVINNKGINPVFTGKWLNSSGNTSRERRRKAKPVGSFVILAPVVGILGKSFWKAAGFHLHIHASVSENIAEFVFEYVQDWYPLFFEGVTSL